MTAELQAVVYRVVTAVGRSQPPGPHDQDGLHTGSLIRNSGSVFCDACSPQLEVVQGQSRADEIALERMATHTRKGIPLFVSFHTLGNDRQSQCQAQGNKWPAL